MLLSIIINITVGATSIEIILKLVPREIHTNKYKINSRTQARFPSVLLLRSDRLI